MVADVKPARSAAYLIGTAGLVYSRGRRPIRRIDFVMTEYFHSRMLKSVAAVYLLLAALSCGLIAWRVDSGSVFSPFSLPSERWGLHLVATLLIVLAAHLLTRFAVALWPLFADNCRDLLAWLGPVTRGQILVLALVSGVGEELFFRGWLLNEAGWMFSSLLFGAVHIPPNRKWFYWPAFAFGMGLILGGLCIWSGSILYAVILHVGINYLNIRFMLARAGGTPQACVHLS